MAEKDLKNERCGCKNNNNKDQSSSFQDVKNNDETCCKTNCCEDQDDVKNNDETCCKTNCCEDQNNVEMIEKDKYLRLFADFENYKKRTEVEKKNISTFAEQLILSELLIIVDDFERFLAAETNTDKKTVEGISLIFKKINSFLNKFGVKKIEIKEGDEFNDKIAESVSVEEIADEEMENKIIKIYENGYKLKDRILRFAKVVVGKTKK